ncbi:PucR family transcriptional regulator [Spirillospora sp. CA-128828]|uniref:PucR family transcriptional regulator n=1 Tax=Spirillospora sp. CA-128828 TaxID=3240033 RepID=UPI003D8E634C
MGLTTEAVLDLEIFRRAGARIFAGHRNLHRTVRWVHAGEIPDIARFLSGGELLLTAGLGIGRTDEEQRTYIRRIWSANAAVLVVELAGRAFATMPDGVVEEAERLGLPVVGLKEEIPFAEVSAQVHEMLVEQRVQELTAEEAIGQAFMNLLLDGQDSLALTAELARRVGHPIVLEDMSHQVLAYAGRTPEADQIMAEWSTHSRVLHELQPLSPRGHRPLPSVRARTAADFAECARRPVVLRGECWGWLHVLHGPAELAGPDLYALDRAAAAVAITLLSEREIGARSAQRQSALVNRLMLGDLSGEEFVRKALALGRDLRRRRLLVIVVGKDGADGTFGEQDLSETLRGVGAPAVVADMGDYTLAVAGLPPDTPDRAIVDALDGHRVRAGISRIIEPANLPAAVQQARNAAAAAAARPDPSVLRFDDLGVLRLLVALAQGPELAGYVEDELGVLLRHDASSANRLLPTLRAYLECDGNKSQAASTLYVQRRTLYYRLERLDRLMGVSLDDPAVRERLLLAVRGLDLLQRPFAAG